MKNRSFILVFFILNFTGKAQFNSVYPIGDNPCIDAMTPMVKKETILFDANPIVRYSFYNNLLTRLANVNADGRNYKYGHAIYMSFRPQLRMYTDNSVPVKMPSYRILIGTQHMWRVFKKDLFAFSFETGHYSNGQYGSTFSTKYEDASKESDSIIAAITPKTNLSDILNRKNGEFSTDLTELILNYRFNHMDGDDTPDKILSINAGATYYHQRMLFIFPVGGYADNQISIYGHWRFLLSAERARILTKKSWIFRPGQRFSLSENIEIIQGAHPSVYPLRFETTFSFYFKNNVGLYIRHIYGHDNYNIRFVDCGQQASLGVTWNVFPTFKIRNSGATN